MLIKATVLAALFSISAAAYGDEDTSPAPAPAPAQQQTDTAQPSQKDAASDKKSKCEEAWKKYKESQECFAQYTVRGKVMEEAFEHCTALSEPSERCD